MASTFLEREIEDRFARIEGYKAAAHAWIRAAGGENPIVANATGIAQDLNWGEQLLKHTEQFRHFKGWVYTAINRIAMRLASQPIYVGRVNPKGGPDKGKAARRNGRNVVQPWTKVPAHVKAVGGDVAFVRSHPLLSAVADPNPAMVTQGLLYVTVAALELTGKAYWWLPVVDGKLQIWPLPGDWVRPRHTAQRLFDSYEIMPPNKTTARIQVPSEEIAYFPLPSPQDPLGTISPAQTQDAAIATDEAIQAAQWRAFKNGIFPGVMIQMGALPGLLPGQEGEMPVLTGDQRKEIIEAIRAIYEGVVNYNEPLILDGLIKKVERFSTSPNEMDFLESTKSTKSRIFQAFGVNPIIAGEIEGSNRAGAAVAQMTFVDNVVNPIGELIGQVMTKKLSGTGYVMWIEPAKPSDAEQTLREWTVAVNKSAVTINEYRTLMLNLQPVPWGNIPVPQSSPGVGPSAEAPPKPSDEVDEEDEEEAEEEESEDSSEGE